jgi:WD40 repeat protein
VGTRCFLLAALLFLVSVPVALAQELRERGTFKGFKFRIDRAEVSLDGKILAAGGGDSRGGELKLCDIASGKEIGPLPGYTNSLYSLAFSADGKRLASGSNMVVQVWDVSALKEIASFKGDGSGAAFVVALNQEGTKVAAAGFRKSCIWEVASGKQLASIRNRVMLFSSKGAAFSRQLSTLALGNYQEVELWEAETGKVKTILSEHRGEVGCMLWSEDDKTLIASSATYYGRRYQWQGDVKFWDVGSGKERTSLPGPFGVISAMALSPDGKTLALVDSSELQAEQDLKLIDVDTGRQQILHAPSKYSFLSLRYTSAGELMVTGASGDTLRVWEVTLPKRDAKP